MSLISTTDVAVIECRTGHGKLFLETDIPGDGLDNRYTCIIIEEDDINWAPGGRDGSSSRHTNSIMEKKKF